ncbi:MAG: hypothetical protein ACOH2M_04905 [Cypionkella sp.]
MFSELQIHLRKRSKLLFAGQIEEYAREFVTPAVFYSKNGVLPICNHGAMMDTAKMLRKSLLDRGIVACEPTIAAAELPRNGRFRVWVEWQEIASDSRKTPGYPSVNYMRQTGSGPLTEMIDWIGSCVTMREEIRKKSLVTAD